jgi:hypothetical protein
MKLIVTFLLSIVIFTATAQTGDAVLNKRLTEYMQLSKNLNIDKLITYMYPRVFELAPKKDLAAALKTAYTSTDFKITIDSLKITRVDPVQKFAKGNYTIFNYFTTIGFEIINAEKKADAAVMVDGFKQKFGAENVSFDEATSIIKIKQDKLALAIKDNYTAGKWTFLGVENSPMLKKIIPAAIVAKYKL